GGRGGRTRGPGHRADERRDARERPRAAPGMERAGRGRGRDRLRDTRRRGPDRPRRSMTEDGGAPRRRAVVKFGGTSGASPAALEEVGEVDAGGERQRDTTGCALRRTWAARVR